MAPTIDLRFFDRALAADIGNRRAYYGQWMGSAVQQLLRGQSRESLRAIGIRTVEIYLAPIASGRADDRAWRKICVEALLEKLTKRDLDWAPDDAQRLLALAASRPVTIEFVPVQQFALHAASVAVESDPSTSSDGRVQMLIEGFEQLESIGHVFKNTTEHLRSKFAALHANRTMPLIDPGDSWGAAFAELQLPPRFASTHRPLFDHLQRCPRPRPTRAWIKRLVELVETDEQRAMISRLAAEIPRHDLWAPQSAHLRQESVEGVWHWNNVRLAYGALWAITLLHLNDTTVEVLEQIAIRSGTSAYPHLARSDQLARAAIAAIASFESRLSRPALQRIADVITNRTTTRIVNNHLAERST